MSEEEGAQVPLLPQPITSDSKAWKAYWEAQGQLWRTEPEIDAKRQKELDDRRKIVPDIKQAIYPFSEMKLSRADVEWLLATHQDGRGPVVWDEEKDRPEYERRTGLDLRGADLSKVNLAYLPLTCLRGALHRRNEWPRTTLEQRDAAAIHLEKSNLYQTHLEDASLARAHLKGAFAFEVHMEYADLFEAHLEGINLTVGCLCGASLRRAFFDGASILLNVSLGDEQKGFARLAGVHWGESDLSNIPWNQLTMLGDEVIARDRLDFNGKIKDDTKQLEDFKTSVRANRRLATALRNQGLNEEADYFAYCAQKLQRVVFQRQRKFGRYLFSEFLDLLAGYGYKPWRSFMAYLIVIIGFAASYYVIGQIVGPHLSPVGSVVFSMTSFHGRGFFPGGIKLDDPLTVLAAIEAFVGLLIEVTFIATLTQRLFGK